MPFDAKVEKALESTQTIDITTKGKKSGKPRRIEIWRYFHDGKVYITGPPGKRSWYANMLAHPEMTYHLKGAVKADLPAKARAVMDKKERTEVFKHFYFKDSRGTTFEAWVESSPLIEVVFTDR